MGGRLTVLLLTLTSAKNSDFMDLACINLDVVTPVHDVGLEGAGSVPQKNQMRAMWTEEQQLALQQAKAKTLTVWVTSRGRQASDDAFSWE